jgi:two-component system, sensor histidine kinase RegB
VNGFRGAQGAWSRFSSSSSNEEPSLTKDLAPNLALPLVVRLRYGIALGAATIIVGMSYAFRLNLPLFPTLTPLAVVVLSNILLGRAPQFTIRFPQQTLGAAFVLDTLSLTVILGVTGGPMNPFSLLYLVQITLSAVVLSKLWTWVLGALSTICFGLLFFFRVPSEAFETRHAEQGLSPHLIGMWIAFVVAAGLITFFTGKISDALRLREQEVLALQEQIARNERLASLATLAAGAAHELGTPLGTIAVVSRELERYSATVPDGDSVREDAKLIRSEVERCRLILERMSVKGAEPMGESPRTILVTELFSETLGQFPEAQRASIVLEAPDEKMAVTLPVQATVQSLAALLRNALDANSSDRKVVLSATRSGAQIAFSVSDHGSGMPEAVLRRIAEPFFTTKDPGKGMGLGTFLARTFAERLGGGLWFESTPGKGTTATMKLPLNTSGRDMYAAG